LNVLPRVARLADNSNIDENETNKVMSYFKTRYKITMNSPQFEPF